MKNLILTLSVIILVFCPSQLFGITISDSNSAQITLSLSKLLIVLKTADKDEYESIVSREAALFGYDAIRESMFDTFANVNLDNYYIIRYRTLRGPGICVSGDNECVKNQNNSEELRQDICLLSKIKGEPGITLYDFNRNGIFTIFSITTDRYTGNILQTFGFEKKELISETKAIQ
jgi:hypothetical protein